MKDETLKMLSRWGRMNSQRDQLESGPKNGGAARFRGGRLMYEQTTKLECCGTGNENKRSHEHKNKNYCSDFILVRTAITTDY